MSDTEKAPRIYSLLEVTKSIKRTLEDRYSTAFWVKAEMNKLNYYSHSGHCYPELVEKQDGKISAQLKSTLWKSEYQKINNNFLAVLKEPLKDGIKVLFLAKITFDPSFGLSLRILDMDVSYTLGDLEKEKQETIQRLIEQGIYTKNKSIKLSLLPQRIAIISVETSKGYADFLDVLDKNAWNYSFFHMLFPSLLQGDKAVDGIISQLKNIHKIKQHFDLVAIIRGGGGDVGLSCYNSFLLAKAIAEFPLPVITGIGHSTNETVAELVSHTNEITPTKLAEFLLQKFHDFSVPVENAVDTITDFATQLMQQEKSNFKNQLKQFTSLTENTIKSNKQLLKAEVKGIILHANFVFKYRRDSIETLNDRLKREGPAFSVAAKQGLLQLATVMHKTAKVQVLQHEQSLKRESKNISAISKNQLQLNNTALNSIEKNIAILNPMNVLKRGYSITLLNGKSVKSTRTLKQGDEIKTLVMEGEITSTVTNLNN